MKIGQKKTVPPMPLDIASVATAMERGNKYQYSSDIHFLSVSTFSCPMWERMPLGSI